MTTLYLAWMGRGTPTLEVHREDEPVDLLVAYPFLREFDKVRSRFNVRSWCLDSGAFSVWNSGRTVDLADYIAAARSCDAAEVFGLDVIGDPKGTRVNLERMWSEGVKAIPTYHYGSPPEELEWCAKHADKIALGPKAREIRAESQRVAWAAACIGRIWPKKVHGFSLSSRKGLEAAPWHSVDSSSWCFAPAAFGAWAGFTGSQLPMKTLGKGIEDFWLEVVEHQKRARWAAWRWRRELAMLGGKETRDGATIYN